MAAPRSAADASTSPNERSQETRYNVEDRAFKLLDRMEVSKKPIVTAPKHKPTKAYLEQLIRDHPELMQNVNVTPPQQLENLKQVRVRVDVIPADDNVKIESEESRDKARKLPVDRVKPLLYLTGVNDPKKVPIGKVSLREAIDMVRGHALDPETFNVKDLAEFHEMQEEDVYHVLDRFKTFEVYNNDDLEAHKAAPWYTKEKLEPMFFSGAPFFEHQIADQEDERRKAWKQYLEKKSKEKPDPKLLEIVGLKSFPAAKKRQAQKDADPPEPPKALP